MQNPGTGNCECNKTSKIGGYLDNNNCSYKKRLFDKLVLTYEEEILNTRGT